MNMEQLPAGLVTNFERRLDGASVPTSKRPEYHKWVRVVAEKQGLFAHGPAGIVGSNFWCQRNFQGPGNLLV
jgi:hypothetical protein